MLNERKIVDIFALDHQGRGIARIDNKVVFVSNVLPNETAEIKITQEKKNYAVGELIKIINISDKRIAPICPHFHDCGGCDVMHMSYEDELVYKENKVKEILKKFAALDPSLVKDIVPNEDRHNYRNKVTFKVDKNLGFYAKNTNDIVKIDYCYIIDDNINELLRYINTHLSLEGIKQVVVRKSKSNDDLMIVFEISSPIDEEKIKKLLAYATSIYIKENNNYRLIKGDKYIKEEMDGINFLISPDSFFQVNTTQATNLYSKIVEYAKLRGNEVVLDLYSGTGTIGLYLSRYAKKVYGVEINKYAVKDANENAKLNNITNTEFIEGDALVYLEKFKGKADVVIVDPPRSGLDRNAVTKLMEIKPKTIVYVSCDPSTLARDLNILKEEYDVIEVTPFDMFSNTYHVETVVLLERK